MTYPQLLAYHEYMAKKKKSVAKPKAATTIAAATTTVATAAIVEEVKPAKFHISTRVVLIVLLLCFLIAASTSAYFFFRYQQSQAIATKEKLTTPEAQSLVNKLGQLIQLPNAETPTIATVTDTSKLASQPFFASAKNGDKVFIYTQSQKAILYRPSINKIINVGPINTQGPTVAGAQTNLNSTPSPASSITSTLAPAQVAIYNGTATNNLTKTYEQQLVSQFSNLTVSLRTNAQNNYPNTLVVDVDGEQTALANQIAQYLHAKVVSLPAGEKSPQADILVILGQDAVK